MPNPSRDNGGLVTAHGRVLKRATPRRGEHMTATAHDLQVLELVAKVRTTPVVFMGDLRLEDRLLAVQLAATGHFAIERRPDGRRRLLERSGGPTAAEDAS